jgi:hypothetical protein
MFRKLLDEGQAGDNIGALLRGVDKDEVQRGQVLAKPGSITPHTNFEANVYVYPVISRRAGGLSIGVNLNPDKVCNFDCPYCQVDRTTPGGPTRVEVADLVDELECCVFDADVHGSGVCTLDNESTDRAGELFTPHRSVTSRNRGDGDIASGRPGDRGRFPGGESRDVTDLVLRHSVANHRSG